jgi:spore germination protein YaaH
MDKEINVTVETKKKTKRKRISIIAMLLIATLIMVNLIAGIVNLRLANRVEEIIVDSEPIVKTETLKDQSRATAERLNLAQIEKLPKDVSSLEIYSSAETSYDSIEVTNFHRQSITIDSKGNVLVKEDFDAQVTPILSLVSNELEEIKVAKTTQEILEVLQLNNFTSVEVDMSLMTLENYEDFIQSLYTKLNAEGITVFTSIPPKWGNEINYSYYNLYSKIYLQKVDFKLINQYSDFIIVEGYNYTTPNNVLAGAISPLDWTTQIIQFLISEDVDRDKIILGINTFGYTWDEAEVAGSQNENYIWIEQQIVSKLNSLEISNLLQDSEIISEEEINNESFVHLEDDGETMLLVYTPERNITNLLNLASDYGIHGVMFR